jgi:hypothetical protein
MALVTLSEYILIAIEGDIRGTRTAQKGRGCASCNDVCLYVYILPDMILLKLISFAKLKYTNHQVMSRIDHRHGR